MAAWLAGGLICAAMGRAPRCCVVKGAADASHSLVYPPAPMVVSLHHSEVVYRPGRPATPRFDRSGAGRPQPHPSRARLRRAAPSWMDRLDAVETTELGRLEPRLPTIVFLYGVGVPLDEIGCRIGHFPGAWEAERALRVISRCIARQLNDLLYHTS